MRKLYMLINRNDDDLPLAVADSMEMLSYITKKPLNSIRTAIQMQRLGTRKSSQYVEVVIDDEDSSNGRSDE